MWVHKGVTVPKICLYPGRESTRAPHCVWVCVRLWDHLPSDTHPGTFREREQEKLLCQATTMGCTDSQVDAGLSLKCFLP